MTWEVKPTRISVALLTGTEGYPGVTPPRRAPVVPSRGRLAAVTGKAGKELPRLTVLLLNHQIGVPLMPPSRTRTTLAHLALAVGAVALLATGADHLDEYAANQFSTVPTIGTLFLLNFISATLVGVGLLLPLGRIAQRFAARTRALLALSGIAIAA